MSAPLFFAFVIAIGVIFLILTHLCGRIENLERNLALRTTLASIEDKEDE